MPRAFWQASGLLVLSNLFMTLAWYGHLKSLAHRPWFVAALVVFVPFLVFYMKQDLRLYYLWAALCMVAAVYFIFRSA